MPVCPPKDVHQQAEAESRKKRPGRKQHARCQCGFTAEVGIGAVVEEEAVQQESGGIAQRKSQYAGKQCQATGSQRNHPGASAPRP